MTTPALALLMAPRQGGGTGMVFLVEMLVIFAIFYFLLIRPQSKERDRHQKMLEAIKTGDEVVTNGGIIGRVVHIDENRLTVRTAENTRVTVERGRVAQVLEGKGSKEGE